MKKIIAALCLVCMMTLLIIPSSANDYKKYGGDSSHIPEEILELLPLKDGDRVYRVYYTATLLSFGLAKDRNDTDIDKLLYETGLVNQIYYSVLSTDGTLTDYYLKDGKACKYVSQRLGDDNKMYEVYCKDDIHMIHDIYLQGIIPKMIDPNISVESSYYISSSAEGCIIFYETNLGDYVYCNFHRSYPHRQKGEYILSWDAYLEYERLNRIAAVKYEQEHPGTVGGGGDTSIPPPDLSAYQIGSPNFDPDAPFPVPKDNESHGTLWLIGGIALAVVLAAAATWFFLRRRKNHADPIDPISE